MRIALGSLILVFSAFYPYAAFAQGDAAAGKARWENLDDRTKALQKTRESADYRAFGEAIRGIVRKIDTRILRNVSFSPLLTAPGGAR